MVQLRITQSGTARQAAQNAHMVRAVQARRRGDETGCPAAGHGAYCPAAGHGRHPAVDTRPGGAVQEPEKPQQAAPQPQPSAAQRPQQPEQRPQQAGQQKPDAAQTVKDAAEQAAAVWEDASKQAHDAYAAEEAEVKSLAEMMKEAKERADKQRERFKLPKNTRYGDMPMEAHARLARARTQAQAGAAAGFARSKILQCQAALRQDPENAARIRATISSLQKAVNRANKKKRELQQEHLSEVQRRKAAERKQKRKEQYLRRELSRRKTMRSIRERGYLRECEVENRLQDQLQQTRMELRQQMEDLNAAYGGVSPEAAAQQYTAQAAAPAPAPSVNIQV